MNTVLRQHSGPTSFRAKSRLQRSPERLSGRGQAFNPRYKILGNARLVTMILSFIVAFCSARNVGGEAR